MRNILTISIFLIIIGSNAFSQTKFDNGGLIYGGV